MAYDLFYMGYTPTIEQWGISLKLVFITVFKGQVIQYHLSNN